MMPGQPPIAPTSPVQQMMNGLSTAQLTPEILQQLQQYQDQQRRMAMAQSLMGNQAQGQNAGLANAGGDVLGALISRRIGQENTPQNQVMQQRYGMNPQQANGILNPSFGSRAKGWLGNIFGMGGGSP